MLTARVILLVGALGAVGAISRFALSELVYRGFGRSFPYGTLVVNVLGCFLIGGLAYLSTTSDVLPVAWRVALTAGFLGGLTTFSTFGYETFRHLEQGQWVIAISNIGASILLGLLAVWVGVSAAKAALG